MATGSKSSRITPLLGLAFFTSAMTAGCTGANRSADAIADGDADRSADGGANCSTDAGTRKFPDASANSSADGCCHRVGPWVHGHGREGHHVGRRDR